jgi:tRNA (guanine-N7-)-methyltransferase
MRSVGGLVERARAGGELPGRHFNPYLTEAAALDGLLLTPGDLIDAIKGGVVSLFPETIPSAAGQSPLIIEIGSYLGKNLVEMAAAAPHARFLGLDITYKRTVKTARKISSMGLANARVGICDARELFAALPPSSVSGVCVFFPDPWPKLRHAKNRLLQGAFFESLGRALVSGGFVWIKTDSRSYFEDALRDAHPNFSLGNPIGGVPDVFAGRDFVTVFEELFQRQGQPISSGVLLRAPY